MGNPRCKDNQFVCCNSCADWNGVRWFDQSGYLICMEGISGACRSNTGSLEKRKTTATDTCARWRPTADLANGSLPGCLHF